MQGESKQHGRPGNVDDDAQRRGHEWIYGGPGYENGKGGLCDEQMLERAAVARFLEAAIKGVKSCVEIIEKNKPHQRKLEIAAALGQGTLQAGSVHEACHVIKHRCAEEPFDGLQNENGTVGTRDAEIAPEKEPDFAENARHGT